MLRLVCCAVWITAPLLLAQVTLQIPGSNFTVAEGINNGGTVTVAYCTFNLNASAANHAFIRSVYNSRTFWISEYLSGDIAFD